MQMIASHLDNSMLLVRKTAKAVFNVASGHRWPGASQAFSETIPILFCPLIGLCLFIYIVCLSSINSF
jgi:hypothetical protein